VIDRPGEVVSGVVGELFRRSAGRITATLARALGPARLDVAEEAVQDALVRALRTWPHTGVPDNPAGWLYRVARNHTLDLVRHDDAFRARMPLLLPPATADADVRGDDELALMFLCCHPGLSPGVQVALTLNTVGGLGVVEIARALLLKPATVAARLGRAKRFLREEPTRIEVPEPDAVESRVDSVLSVLYLMFNAGYDAYTGEDAVRAELCAEAIRLGRLLCADPRTDLPRARALLALMLLHGSRLPARVDDGGDPLLLSDQDRTRWDQGMVAEGVRLFGASCTGPARSAYHVEAAIAVCHATAGDLAATDWAMVVSLYDELMAIRPTPVAALNRAVAVLMSGGDGVAASTDTAAVVSELAALRDDPALRDYHLLPAALGGLCLRAGQPAAAAGYYAEALTRPCSAPARRFLRRQLDRCQRLAGDPTTG
jgi:predicted RNA polymerase sigma factor